MRSGVNVRFWGHIKPAADYKCKEFVYSNCGSSDAGLVSECYTRC